MTPFVDVFVLCFLLSFSLYLMFCFTCLYVFHLGATETKREDFGYLIIKSLTALEEVIPETAQILGYWRSKAVCGRSVHGRSRVQC